MSKSYESAFDRFSKKWMPTVFKDEWDNDKFGPQPDDYANLSDIARLVLLFTRFLMHAYNTVGTKRERRALFVFVTKKGYWLYRCIRQHLYLLPQEKHQDCYDFWNAIQVRSDRYFTKSPDVSEFSDYLLFVVDDIVHTGANFQRMKQLVKDSGLTIERYIAFAIEDCGENLMEGLGDIWACSRLSPNDLGKVSIEEIILFHSLGVPYAIDLPVLKVAGGSPAVMAEHERAFFSGRLTKEEFDRLCSQCTQRGWDKVDSSYKINNWSFNSCFFWNISDSLQQKFKNLLHSLIVECSYCEIDLGEGQQVVDVTFIPFAIMRSVKWYELVVLFAAAFGQTPYCNNICSYLRVDNAPSQALATALYRSVVFYLSGYTAANFNGFLRDLGLSLELKVDHMQEHWDQNFMESVQSIFIPAVSREKNEFPITDCSTILDFYRFDDILSDPAYWDADILSAPEKGRQDTDLEMYKFFVKGPDFEKTDYTFEKLEIEIAKRVGKPVNDQQFKENFLQALIGLLNKSAISNIVSYDKISGTVTRGFRSGENCALLLPYAQPEVFCGLFAYYKRCEGLSNADRNADQQYKHHFDYFKEKLLEYIGDTGYDLWIDRTEAIRLLDYFKGLPNAGRQIKNREYIVEEFEQDGSPHYGSISKNLKEFVENLELPNE